MTRGAGPRAQNTKIFSPKKSSTLANLRKHGGVRETMTADAPLCDKYTVDTHVRERKHVASIVSPEEGRMPTTHCHPIPQPSFFLFFRDGERSLPRVPRITFFPRDNERRKVPFPLPHNVHSP